ncbi:MAG: class I tRNA ligase family protein, partial [Gammaproteobacteria bacterium]|nr:class I tRNA ligase family protein [Gammaproteobacteria bacterium]
EEARRGTRRTLVRVLEALLRLAHPLMPFITEEILQRVAPLAGKSGATIMLQPYPQAEAGKEDGQAVADMEWVQAFIVGVRSIRGEMNIAPGKPLAVLLDHGGDEDRRRLEENRAFLATLARLESVAWLEAGAPAPVSATALVGWMRILIPMAGLIDKDAELARLGKEIARLGKDLERAEGKLANPSYVNKAPAEVVEKERQRALELRSALEKLGAQRAQIETL